MCSMWMYVWAWLRTSSQGLRVSNIQQSKEICNNQKQLPHDEFWPPRCQTDSTRNNNCFIEVWHACGKATWNLCRVSTFRYILSAKLHSKPKFGIVRTRLRDSVNIANTPKQTKRLQNVSRHERLALALKCDLKALRLQRHCHGAPGAMEHCGPLFN